MATSDLRNQYWAMRGMQTGFTVITGAMETADAVREAARPPTPGLTALKVGGSLL